MTIAIGMRCAGGIVFGADTEECLGDMRRRVHKIPTGDFVPATMITGACLNGHLMDTAVERIFDRLQKSPAKDSEATGALLDNVMVGLYRREFKAYPDQESTEMKLLVAVKPTEETEAGGWSIHCSAVRRMRSVEIVGTGELVQFVADNLYAAGIPVETGVLATVQVLSAAKKRVQGVGGESYVHVLRDDGTFYLRNFRFLPDVENLYDFFLEHGRALLLATGNDAITDQQYEEIVTQFVADLRWKRKRIAQSNPIRPSTSGKLEPEP